MEASPGCVAWNCCALSCALSFLATQAAIVIEAAPDAEGVAQAAAELQPELLRAVLALWESTTSPPLVDALPRKLVDEANKVTLEMQFEFVRGEFRTPPLQHFLSSVFNSSCEVSRRSRAIELLSAAKELHQAGPALASPHNHGDCHYHGSHSIASPSSP